MDEPSAGLDHESRREFRNLLSEMRKTHSILITTHDMEEAEALADHIVIMSDGEVLCEGNAGDLKLKYAKGYTMKLLTTETFKTTPLLNVIHQHIPRAFTKVIV